MKPLGKNVLIKPLKEESEFLVPETSESKAKGEVVAVGKEVEEIKPGDKVAYRQYAESKLDDFYVVEEQHILVILED